MEKCHGVKPVSQKMYSAFTVFYESSAYAKDQDRIQPLVKCPFRSFLLSSRQHSFFIYYLFHFFFLLFFWLLVQGTRKTLYIYVLSLLRLCMCDQYLYNELKNYEIKVVPQLHISTGQGKGFMVVLWKWWVSWTSSFLTEIPCKPG